jgi:hypothetical protein
VSDAQATTATVETPAHEAPLSIFVRFLRFGLLA